MVLRVRASPLEVCEGLCLPLGIGNLRQQRPTIATGLESVEGPPKTKVGPQICTRRTRLRMTLLQSCTKQHMEMDGLPAHSVAMHLPEDIATKGMEPEVRPSIAFLIA